MVEKTRKAKRSDLENSTKITRRIEIDSTKRKQKKKKIKRVKVVENGPEAAQLEKGLAERLPLPPVALAATLAFSAVPSMAACTRESEYIPLLLLYLRLSE